MLEALSDNNPQLRQGVVHMFYAGMRSYEILNLKPSWYEFKEDEAIEIEIPSEYAKGKRGNKEPEYCFLPARFREEVQNYILDQHDTEHDSFQEFIQETDSEDLNHLFDFIGDSDKDFRALARERYHLNKELEKVAKKSGINKAEKISAHRLRKSFIHHIYEGDEEGLNLSRTSNLARHSNTDLTDSSYLNIEKRENKKDYQKVMG
jgi:integrase